MSWLMPVLRFLGILAEVILLFNVLIVVHELGHFFAARSAKKRRPLCVA